MKEKIRSPDDVDSRILTSSLSVAKEATESIDTIDDSRSKTRKKRFRNSWRSASPITKLTVIFSALVTLATIVYAAIAGWQLVVIQRQLAEMRGSGIQTDQLILLYGKQLEELKRQSGDIHDLAMESKHQADASKTIADNSILQSQASRDLAASSTGQLLAMQEEMEVSQRPRISITPTIAGPSKVRAGRFTVEIIFTYHNGGPSTAIVSVMSNKLTVFSATDFEYGKQCMELAKTYPEEAEVILPNSDLTRDVILEMAIPAYSSPNFIIWPAISTCMAYHPSFGKALYSFGTQYSLYKAGLKPNTPIANPFEFVDVPSKDLILRANPGAIHEYELHPAKEKAMHIAR